MNNVLYQFVIYEKWLLYRHSKQNVKSWSYLWRFEFRGTRKNWDLFSISPYSENLKMCGRIETSVFTNFRIFVQIFWFLHCIGVVHFAYILAVVVLWPQTSFSNEDNDADERRVCQDVCMAINEKSTVFCYCSLMHETGWLETLIKHHIFLSFYIYFSLPQLLKKKLNPFLQFFLNALVHWSLK